MWSVALYGSKKKKSLALREKCRLWVFEDRILRQIFGCKRDENGKWRRLHNEVIHSLYHSSNIVRVVKSRRLRWVGHIAWLEEVRSAFKTLTDKFTGKRHLGRLRHRWEYNIGMDFIEIWVNMRNWVYLAQDMDYWRALANAALKFWVP